MARVGARHHGRPPVRLEPASGALCRTRRDRRGVRRCHRQRCRSDDPRADGRVDRRRQVRIPDGPARAGALQGRGRPREPGHLGGVDQREVEDFSRRPRPFRLALATQRGARNQGRPLPERNRAGARRRGRDDGDRRRHPRDVARETRVAQAVVQAGGRRRPCHRRQLVADHRRVGGAAHHERGERRRNWDSSPAPASSASRSRPRTRATCSPRRFRRRRRRSSART